MYVLCGQYGIPYILIGLTTTTRFVINVLEKTDIFIHLYVIVKPVRKYILITSMVHVLHIMLIVLRLGTYISQ